MCLPFYHTRSLWFRLPGFLISSQIRLISPCGLFVVLLFHSGKPFFSVLFVCYGIYYLFGYWENEGTGGKIECWNGFWFLVFCDEKFEFLGFVSIWSLGLITRKAEGNEREIGCKELMGFFGWLVFFFIAVEMCTYLGFNISSHLFGYWEREGKRWIVGCWFFFFFSCFLFFLKLFLKKK